MNLKNKNDCEIKSESACDSHHLACGPPLAEIKKGEKSYFGSFWYNFLSRTFERLPYIDLKTTHNNHTGHSDWFPSASHAAKLHRACDRSSPQPRRSVSSSCVVQLLFHRFSMIQQQFDRSARSKLFKILSADSVQQQL